MTPRRGNQGTERCPRSQAEEVLELRVGRAASTLQERILKLSLKLNDKSTFRALDIDNS